MEYSPFRLVPKFLEARKSGELDPQLKNLSGDIVQLLSAKHGILFKQTAVISVLHGPDDRNYNCVSNYKRGVNEQASDKVAAKGDSKFIAVPPLVAISVEAKYLLRFFDDIAEALRRLKWRPG